MTDAPTESTPAAPDTLITDAPPAVDFTQGKPDGFPDDFWDAEKKAPVVDKLFNAYSQEKKRADGLRVKLSKGEFEGKAPEDIKEYTLTLDDKLKPLVPDDDPLLHVAREAAKAKGMPKEMFDSTFTPIIAKLAELKAQSEASAPTEEEIAAARQAEIEKLGPTGHRIVESIHGFIKEAQANGTFSESEANAAKRMVFDADTARVMNKLRMMAGGRDQVPVEVPVDNKASRSDVETKMAKALVEGNEAEYTKFSQMLARFNN